MHESPHVAVGLTLKCSIMINHFTAFGTSRDDESNTNTLSAAVSVASTWKAAGSDVTAPSAFGSDTTTPKAAGSDTTTSSTAGSDTTTPNAGSNTMTPSTAGSDTTTSSTAGSDTTTPNAGSNTMTPSTAGSDTMTPNAAGSNTITSSTAGSDTTTTSTAGSGTATPNAAGSNTITSSTAGSNTTTSSTAGSDTTTPNAAGSDTTTPSTAGSGTATPNAAGSNTTTPNAAGGSNTMTSSTAGSHATTSKAAGSGATASNVTPVVKKTTYDRIKQSNEWNLKLDELTNKLNNSPNTLVSELDKIKVCTEDDFQIDEGTSETCAYLGLHSTDDISYIVREVVVKIVTANGKKERKNEAKILTRLDDHKNIVQYMDGRDVDEHMYTVFQLCDFTLEAWVRDNKTTTDWENRARDMVRQLLVALKYLHENKTVHCDLSPENILVKEDQKLKLGDFGLSRKLKVGHDSKGAPAEMTAKSALQQSKIILGRKGKRITTPRSWPKAEKQDTQTISGGRLVTYTNSWPKAEELGMPQSLIPSGNLVASINNNIA
ncbi:hypothetical protein LSAT2_019087 [Lamellibrachia satsuma]|nr:hypothetical protein LSAT2_019087 [Lamellibrachia satsuma]